MAIVSSSQKERKQHENENEWVHSPNRIGEIDPSKRTHGCSGLRLERQTNRRYHRAIRLGDVGVEGAPPHPERENVGGGAMKDRYEVIVGNIGRVHEGSAKTEALRHFNAYVRQSKAGYGRAGGEEVALLKDGEIIREHIPDHWFPVSEIESLLKSLKKDIGDECRCTDDPDDTTPGMCVTISTKDGANWSYQTGDNSFTGSCYGDPHWAVIYLYRRANCKQLAEDAVEELKDLVAEAEL
jgi:hypothetical protein